MIKKFCNKAKILIGDNSLEMINYEIDQSNCTRVLILTDDIFKNMYTANHIKRMLDSANINNNYLILSHGLYATESNVKLALAQYIESASELIIAVGDGDIVSVAKAVKLLVATGKKQVCDVTNTNVMDNTPLFLVPTFLDDFAIGTSCASVMDSQKDKFYRMQGITLSPTHIFIDKRVLRHIKPNDIALSQYVITGLALLTLLDKGCSISSKIYAFTALDILKACSDGDRELTARELVVAQMYAGIGYYEVKDNFLDSIVLNMSLRSGVPFSQVFEAVFSRYLKMYDQEFSLDMIDIIGGIIDRNEYSNLPKEKRADYVKRIAIDKMNEVAEKHNIKLSNYGINGSMVDQVVDRVLEDMRYIGSQEKAMSIRTILYNSL